MKGRSVAQWAPPACYALWCCTKKAANNYTSYSAPTIVFFRSSARPKFTHFFQRRQNLFFKEHRRGAAREMTSAAVFEVNRALQNVTYIANHFKIDDEANEVSNEVMRFCSIIFRVSGYECYRFCETMSSQLKSLSYFSVCFST